MKRALSLVLALAAAASAQAIESSVVVVDPVYRNGYRCGVKQPVGSTLGGVSVHNLCRELNRSGDGSPDYLVWVDENPGGAAAVLELGHDDAQVTNPGGMAQFGPDGSVWYALSGRARDLPFDLMHSGAVVLDDFVTMGASTTPLFHPLGETGLHVYRYAGSTFYKEVRIVAQRYDLAGAAPVLLGERDLAVGSLDPVAGKIGLEQLWSRHDPRYGTALTWQWWQIDERWFGSNPFLQSRDGGVTWVDAAGAARDFPLAYADRDPVLVPIDHIAAGVDADWLPRDLGFTPAGAPWMVLPDGLGNVRFCLWSGGAWSFQTLASGLLEKARPYACGTVDRSLVFVYAVGGEVYCRVSLTGVVWGPPVLVDSVGSDRVNVVSYCQPVDYKENGNVARFVVTHFQGGTMRKLNYENAVRFLRLEVRRTTGV